jgi:7,8-dihydro-6-hydroxymethylpterin dimethyltransferase
MDRERARAACDRRFLSSAEVAAWPPGGPTPPGDDLYRPLRGALRRNGLLGPLQVAGRHLPIGCVALEITQRCNLDCELCYLSEHSEAVHDLPLEEIFRRIDLIERHYGAGTHVQVTGGDPTLRRRDELVAIVGQLAARGMRPALFTNGIKASRDLLGELASVGLNDVAFHVDTTQRRKGYASETALNQLRLKYIEAARDLGLHIMFNTTVTQANLADVPGLVRFFIAQADAVHLASFQLQADTGRGVLGKAGPGITLKGLTALVNRGAGVDLGFEFPIIGHPECNRYTGCLVAGAAVAPLFDDEEVFARLLASTQGYAFERHDKLALLRSCLAVALRNPGLWPQGFAYAARKLWQLRRGLISSRGRVHKLSFHVHHFMDADRLERSRCESCVFMTMTRNGPVSMCVHNAKRDVFILESVSLRVADGRAFWDPLQGRIVAKPDPSPPDPSTYPLKRLKGRARARMLAQRAAERAM